MIRVLPVGRWGELAGSHPQFASEASQGISALSCRAIGLMVCRRCPDLERCAHIGTVRARFRACVWYLIRCSRACLGFKVRQLRFGAFSVPVGLHDLCDCCLVALEPLALAGGSRRLIKVPVRVLLDGGDVAGAVPGVDLAEHQCVCRGRAFLVLDRGLVSWVECHCGVVLHRDVPVP
jgi:hypothetical protein